MRNSPLSEMLTPPSSRLFHDRGSAGQFYSLSAMPTTASKANRAFQPCAFSPGSEFDSASEEVSELSCAPIAPRLVFADLPPRRLRGGPALPLRRLLDYDKRPQVLCARERMKKYVCRYCGEVLAAGCALGGHITKFHSAQLRRGGQKR